MDGALLHYLKYVYDIFLFMNTGATMRQNERFQIISNVSMFAYLLKPEINKRYFLALIILLQGLADIKNWRY
jgi:hypothetical protein